MQITYVNTSIYNSFNVFVSLMYKLMDTYFDRAGIYVHIRNGLGVGYLSSFCLQFYLLFYMTLMLRMCLNNLNALYVEKNSITRYIKQIV